MDSWYALRLTPHASRPWLSSRIQRVEIQHRVPHERIARPRLASPDRVVREQDDVPLLDGDVHYGRVLGDLLAASEETRDEEVLRVRLPAHDAGPRFGRNDEDAVAFLVVRQGQR